MANSANFEASLRIKAGVEGTDNIDKLAKSISEAGVDVTGLTEESAKLAKQFGEIEQKQALIDQFRELKKATSEANTEWQTAQAATAAYTSQIQDAKDSLEALSVAMQNQGDMSQEEARATQAEYNAMVREIRNLEEAQANQATRASQLSTQYDDLNSRLVTTRSAMHDVGLSTTGLNDQQRALARESEQAQAALGELTAEAERLNAIAQARITLGIDTDDNARRQIEEVTAAYETLRNSGTLTAEELARASELQTQRVAELEAQLGETAPTLETLTEEFGKVTAAAGGLTYVTKAAMDFETAMSGVKKVVDGTPEQIQALSTQIQQMSVDMGMTTDAIAEIAAQGGQLGIPIEKLGEFTKMAGQMSVAFGMTAEDAGDAAAKIANVFGIPIEKVGELGDAINTLGNTSAAKESEIVDVMQRIGGQAKQFGLATEEAAALSAAFISLGKSPEVAGTAINALLTKLQTANVQSDDFKEALAGIGLNANKMADDIAANPQQALSNFLKTLASMDSQQRSVATFKLFGQEYVDDINALVGGLDTYNKALDSVKDKSATAGAMQKEFNAKMDTSAQSIEQAKQSINVLAQTVGKELLPVVSLGAKAVGGVAQAVTSFAENFPLLTKFAVLVASAQVSMVALNSVMTLAGAIGLRSGGQIAAGFLGGTAAIDGATVAATRFNAVNYAGFLGGLKQIATQFGAVAIAAVAGYEGGKWLYEKSPAVRSFGDELGRVLAYMDAIVTDRTFNDVNKNFETAAESAKRLAEAEKKHAETIEGKAEAYIKADQATKQTQQTNEQLTESIQKTDSTVKSLTTEMGLLKATGQENTETYKNLNAQIDQNKEKLDVLTQAQEKANAGNKDSVITNQQLVNEIKITEASLESMKNRLAEMETAGQKNTQGYKDLSDEIGQTTDKLDLLNAEASKKGIGELLKTDLDKASESFKALGLDAEEFATGINSKANTALNAFVDIAHLAEGDVNKLARAYNAARQAVGDNQLAQDELNKKLLQVAEGNQAFASAVQSTAKAQRDAKNASEEQQAALDKLGISMTAANYGMSKSGEEMVRTLRSGIDAIKEQATSADALKTSLKQAFDTAIAGAKTTGDYEQLIKLWEDLGKQGKITGQDLTDGLTAAKDKLDDMKDGINSVNEAYKVLGLQTKEQIAAQAASYKEAYEMIVNDGNASASQLQAAFEKYAKSAVAANKDVASSQLQSEAAARGLTVAVDESGRVSVEKSKDIIKSNRDVSQSINNVADSAFGIGKGIEKSVDRGITALGKLNKQLGETEARNKAIQEASAASSQAMNDSNGAAIVKSFENNKGLNTREGMLDFLRQTGIAAERAEKEVAALMYQFGGSGTMNWNRANGVPEGIQMSIEELAKYKMPSKYLLDLSKTIKAQEAARLEDEKRIQANEDFSRKQIELDKQTRAAYAELNKVRGDDRLSFEVQQTNKLDDIRNKILTAQREGDAESAYHYQKMLEIQQAINAEESNKKDALSVSKAQEESARARAKIEKEARDLEEKPRQAPKSYEQSINTTSLAREVVSSLDERIKQAKAEAIVEFSKQLMDEAKRLAR